VEDNAAVPEMARCLLMTMRRRRRRREEVRQGNV